MEHAVTTDRPADRTAPEPDGPSAAEPPADPATPAPAAAPHSAAGAVAPGPAGPDPGGPDPHAPAPETAVTAPGPAETADGRAGAGPRRSPAAEALAAAVRAVESGERSAASFFAEPRPPAPRRPAAPAGAPAPAGGAFGPRPGPPSPGGSGSAAPAPALPAARRAELSGEVREVLARGGAPESLTEPVVDALGEPAAVALQENPWQLLSVPRVRPEQADGFARALLGPGAGPGDGRRAEALVQWLLERAALRGHTVLEPSALREALARQSVPDPDAALRDAVDAGGVLLFEDPVDEPGPSRGAAGPAAGPGTGARTDPGTDPGTDGQDPEAERPVRVLLGLERHALAEESLAEGLGRILATFTAGAGAGGDAGWRAAAEAAPSPSAAELIRAAARHGLVAHTGGEAARAEPLALLAAAAGLGLRACAAVHGPAGRLRAAALLSPGPSAASETAPGAPGSGGRDGGPAGGEGPGAAGSAPVVTVAGLLAGTEGPARDQDGALALDLLVVLDAPLLDVETAAALVESVPDGARLVLSGDPGLLRPAGPGEVFADLLAAAVCPRLASRTPDPGPLGELVSAVGAGELPAVDAPGKEVVIVPVQDAGEAVHRTVQLVADSVPRAIGVASEATQVITPVHGGPAGTRALNAALKERLNPGPGRFGGFDPGDRVVHSPAPGRALVATVAGADAEGLWLEWEGGRLAVPREQVAAGALRHGWAVTAHQAAGTVWPAAVVVLPGDAADTLTRAWVYTAFGRAERHLSVVHGVEQALPRAVAGVPVTARTTRLRTLLRALPPPA
ncbi:helix-hairpin-helix domain-containing protein [Streptomyces zingiberis]|uniref:helix-hairpin-helix domain-containing protein n=1 Tax=Streptomyces zingiberis TaxID=2053010 RepID=UPI004063CB56